MNVNDFLKKRKQEESTNTQTGTENRSSSFIQGLANERRQNVSERFGTSAYGAGNSKQGWPSTSKINQPQTEKTNTESMKIAGKRPGETSRSGQSWKERQERLAGQQMANQMQKESGIIPSAKKETTKTEKKTASVTNLGGLSRHMQKPETTVQELDGSMGTLNRHIQKPEVDNRPEKKQTRVQKPSADHYDAEQIRQYQEQEIGDYKKVLEEQNQLVNSDYKNYQEAQQALKEAAMAYHTKQNGENWLAYTKARNQFDHALEALQMSSKRSTELTDEVNSMVSAYQNQYDDHTRYSGKDYAGMQQYITELSDQLDQTGESEKNAETGQNLREQYQEEIDRAEKYSYSLMNKDQLQQEYDRLDAISHSGEAKPVYMTDTGLPVFNTQNLSDETIDRANEKKRLIQRALNQLEMNDAKAAYESYADGTAAKPTYDLAGQNLIDVFEKMVNGERIAKNAGNTTEIALRDQVDRNMKYLPDDAKEVMLQFLADKDYVSAANYYKAYESTMTANYANTQYSELKDWASQNFGTALGGSIGAGFAGAVTPAGAWIDNTFNAINNKLVDVTGEGEYRFSDVNGDLYRGARTAAALQEGVQAYNATTGKWEDALNLASGALTSSVQNVVQFALFGSASLPFMAASAAGQSAYQGLKSGLSEEQAAVTSTVSGLIEYMTEKLPLEHLLDKINTIGEGGVVTVKQIAEMIRKQGMEEASEEVVGNIADNLFDMWYNKDNSEFRQYSAQLQREGMSKAEADMEAFGKFFVGDSIEAAAAAYLSTFLLIGGNVVSANLQAAQYGKEMKAGETFKGTQYTVDEMNTVLLSQQIPGEYAGGKYAAEQLKNQVLEGKQLSNRMLGFAAMTNNQVIKDASKYLNQALEMSPETQSFKMAMAMTEQYDVGSQLPSKAFVESLKSQIEADKEAAKQPNTKAKSAQTTTGETLSHYQTVFAENGVGIRDAKNRTEVMNKLILGQSVSDAELRKLHMGAKLTKQMLYELTGVEIPDGVVKEKDLMQYYRSAREGFEAKIKAEAQERTAQDAQAAAEQQRAFEAEQMRQMDIADRVVEATKSDVDERLQYFMEHGKLKETEKGAENEQTGEAVLRGAGGRVDGQSDGSTDAAPTGNAEADARGTEGQNRSGDAGVQEKVQPVKGRGKAVSSRDFGLKNATTLKTAREVLPEDEAEPMRKFREDVKAKYGYDVVYTDGDFVQRKDGRDVIVRGLFDQESKRLFVNANYFRLSYDQIGNHEVFHIEVSNGDVDLQAMAEAFNEATGNKEILDSLVNQYMEKLALDDYNSALEEVFADMNGKFNGIRSVNVTAYQDIFEKIKAASPKNGEAASSMPKFSVETAEDGQKYVLIDQQQGRFIGLNNREAEKLALEIIQEEFSGQTIPLGEYAAVTIRQQENWKAHRSGDRYDGARKYVHDGTYYENSVFQAKMRAAANLDEMLEAAEYVGHSEDHKNHTFATDGFDYYKTTFVVGGRVFEGTFNIGLSDMGATFYGMTKITQVTNYGTFASALVTDAQPNYGDLRNSRVARNAESVKQKNSEVVDEADRKAAQFAIIRDSNAADDAYHTWIRSAPEIKTLSETLADPEWAEYDEYDPDYTRQMAEDAVRTGKITVYSSYKIGNGVFVTPSRMEAESYSGDGKVYSKTVNVADVAWIDPTQGQYAPTNTADIRYSQEVDSDGRALTDEQKIFFSGSKARDSDGRLLPLYRGHKRGSTVYSTDYRGAIWSTTDKAYAETYGNVDEVYANIKNPYELTVKVGRDSKGYDIDEAISNAKAGNHDGAIITFEYDFNNDPMSYDNWMSQNAPNKPADEVVRFASVRPGETIGEFMGRAKAGPLEKHVVVWDSSQFKSAENLAPTRGKDIRYSQETDEEYRRLAEHPRENRAALQKMVDAAAKAAGYTKKAYHGTDGDFWTFSLRNRGKNGEMLGVGYYFAEHEADAANYARGGGKVLPVYLDIQNPVSTTKLTITPEQWGKFLDYAQEHRDEYIDGAWKGNSIKKDFELRYMNDYDSDTDLISGFINATAGRNAEVAEAYLQMLKDSTGIDGVVQGEGEGKVYVAFTPEQIKSAEIVTRNDSGDVIPLRERFNASRGDIRYSIDSDMTEDERYRELRGKTVAVTPEAKYTDEQLASIHTLEQLNAKAKSKAEKVIRPLAESLGILNRSMKTPDVEIDFTFSKNKGLRESMSKQLRYGGTYADFAKALVNLDGILENAVLIEQHKDKYAGTVRENPYLNSVSVLVGVFRDGDSLIPTQIEIKDTADAGGTLYMTVAMTKIETGVLGSTMNQNGTSRSLIPISSYNLAEIFANVNPADGHFLKYVPDGFLNDAQKAAKQSAIREDANRIQSYRQKNSVDTDLMDVWREQNPGQTAVTQEGFDKAQRTLLDRYRNDTVLKTAYDSVGAAKNANETQTKTSKARTNTFEKLFSEAEKGMEGLREEDMTYDVIREKESLEGAAARLAQDFDGEVDDLLKRTDWTGEDLDTAMGALSVFREEAQKSGDYSKVVEMAQKIRENATKGGQFVQAFAKYNRTTPEGLLVKAIDEVDKAKNPVQRKNVNPIVQTMIDSYTEQIRDLRAEQKQAVQDAKLAGQMGQGKADAAELRKIRERYENQIKALNEQRDKLLADAVQAGRESQKKADNAAMKRITDAYNKRIDEWQKKIDLAKAAYDEMFQKGQTQQQQTDARAQERKIQKFEDMLAKLQAERDEILNGGLDALRATNKGISDAKANEITKNLTEMADALDAVKEGDVDALIDVIQRQAKIRKTPVSNATLNNLKKQNFEWLWNAASTQYLQIAKDYVKPSMARRVATFQTMSHLFNMRTGMRNVVSNIAFSAVEAAANDISQIPDMVLGAITGKRGVGFDQAIFSKANWEGFMEGYSKVQPELALDIETAENGKYGTGRRTNKMTGNLLSRNLSRVERLMGYELNLTDEVTKGSIRAETIRQLQRFVDSGKMTMEEAIQAAEQEMLYRTFQDDTLVGTTLSQLKKLGNLVGFGDSGQKIGGLTVHEFGLGDLLTKYTQVPGALVHRSIEFTPAGYAKAIYALVMAQKNGGIKNMSALQQRNIALAVGRATIGTGLIALFAALTKAGIILNADDEDDPDAKALRAAGGISGTQINVDALGRLIRGESADIQDGDELWGIEFMQPVNGSMTIGALLNNSKEGQNLAQRWLEAILHGTVQSIDDLSVMNTLRTIQNAIDYSQEETLIGQGKDVLLELAKSSATGFIPSPVRQFAQGMDAYYRDAYGSKNLLTQGKEQAMNAIPGLRQNLPTKLTNFGEDKTYGGSTVQRWMNAFFMPGSVRTYQADDTVQELLDLYYASGNEKIIPAKSAPYKIQVGNERYEMSAEERREYQTTMGQTAKLWMEQFFDSEDYAGMTTEERAAQVEKIVKSAEDVAKNKVAGTMGVDSAKVFDQGITVETTRLGLAGESGVSPSLPDSKSIGDPDRTGYKYELTNEELKQWEDLYNGAYTKEVGDVIQSDAYAKADDAEKADMIRDAKETAKNTAKDEFLDALQSVGIRAELDESSDLYEVRKGVTEGANIEKTVKRLKSDGVSDNSISSAITSTIRDGYLAGDINEKTANKKLVQYGAAKDENDAYWKIREWEGGEDYKKYDRFYASVENGKKLDDTISYYTSHGVEPKTLKSQITSHFKPLYLSASVQERQYMKEYLLDAYESLGVSRNKAAKNIDKWLK